MTRLSVVSTLGLALLLLAGCGGGPDNDNGNANVNDNINDNGTPDPVRSETRDFSEFTVFSYDAGPLSCAEVGKLARATVVNLADQGFGYRVDLISLEVGDPASDNCEEDLPPALGCLTLRGPETGFLTDSEIDDLLGLFGEVQVLLDPLRDCQPDDCDDEYEWDAETRLSSASCADAPRLSPQQGQAIRDLLEAMRNR